MEIKISYEGQPITLEANETILDACERVGIDVPSSCRSGACQSCLMQSTNGTIPKNSQNGLRESLQKSGHFLACICRPTESISCKSVKSSSFQGKVAIEKVFNIGLNIIAIRFNKPSNFTFAAGQFATFQFENLPARSYSLIPDQKNPSTFDIHIKKIQGGRMSTWFHEKARVQTELNIEGPKGECIYYSDQPDQNLLLVGTGTGMAPLYGIAEDALIKGHKGTIQLIQGALSEERLYLTREFKRLSDQYANLSYCETVLKPSLLKNIPAGDIKNITLKEFARLSNVRAYLCGDPGLVKSLKKQLFLRGLSLNKIHADPFIGTSEQDQ